MNRSLGLPLLLVVLVIGGALYAMQMRSEGPTSPGVTAAETQAIQESAGFNFQQADQAMQAYYAENATYVGATLPPGSGVTVAAASQSSYCLQTGVGTAVEHELGPGGAAAPGACA